MILYYLNRCQFETTSLTETENSLKDLNTKGTSMTCDYKQLPHKGIQTLTPYTPGKSIDELAREQGITDIIKLASNENPRGCSPRVKDALAALTHIQISTYPIPSTHPLLVKLAEKLGISSNMLCLGHGSDALFQLLIICFALHQEKHILTHDYAFQTYKILAKIFGVPLVSTPILEDWQIDIDAMIQACNDKTALIFIANPNNPTGTFLPYTEIERLLNAIPESTMLVLDEAYYEFLDPSENFDTLQLLKKFPNLVITRTFSKGYGLAGLRLGYAIAHPDICRLLQKVALPFTISQTALTAGLAALEDEEFLQQTAELNRQELKRVRQTLEERHYHCLPSFANFITFDCKMDGGILYNALLNQGIIVRPLYPYGLVNYLRVTIGTPAQNTRFLDTLAQITTTKRILK